MRRAFDLVIAIAALLLTSPILVTAVVAIALESKGSPIYRQRRIGRDGEPFEMLKLRTMVSGAEYLGAGLAVNDGDPRITRIGAVLRRFSLDELPQLLNVLKGEMSLVGPRPLILEEDRHVAEWARERLNLKPGLTGLWQVLGRNHIPFEEMTKLDYVYVTNWSLSEDIRLILRTIPALMRPSRAY